MEKIPQIPQKSFEHPEKRFQNRLKKILNLQLNAENIKTFADDAMNQLIGLIDEVKIIYQKETNSTLTGKELEDKAFEHYNLQGIIKLLDKIQEKSEQIAKIYQYVKNIPQSDELIVPPDKLNLNKTQKGDIPWERKKIIPRLTTLLYILETDFNIPKEEVDILEGIVSNEQMRAEPYYRIIINELNRLIYICIEEGNVTYIFDQEKLDKNGIDVELMDILTKKERNESLEQYPNIGTKLNQSSRWRENISKLLDAEKLEYKTTATIESEANTDENIPQVSTSEFNEWRGFWTDEKGKHWAHKNTLKKRMGLAYTTINKYIKTLISQDIKDLNGIIQPSYCYENLILIPEIKKLINTTTVATKNNFEQNQWKGFLTDENGKHWSNKSSLANLIGLGYKTIKNHIGTLRKQDIKDLSGIIQPSYCYEDIIEIPEIKTLIHAISVSKENNPEKNQWKGFWTDSNGKHWSNKDGLANHSGLSIQMIIKHIGNHPYQNIKDLRNQIRPSYCYEDFIQIPEIKKLMNTPTVATKNNFEQNQWKGFWTDKNGKHWSNINTLAKYTGLDKQTINKGFVMIAPQDVKNLSGWLRPSYCYEDLIQIPEIKKSINTHSVATKNNFEQNQWKGFLTDENGKHWSNINALAKHIELDNKTIKRHIKTLIYKDVKDLNQIIQPSYCYEEIIEIPEIKILINTTSVSKENNHEKNQWDGFWTDENGKHWGHKQALREKIKSLGLKIIKNKGTLLPQSIKNKRGQISPAYCYEDLIQIPEIQKLLKNKNKID